MTKEQRTARIADRRDYLTTLRIRHDTNVKKIQEVEREIADLLEDETEDRLIEVEKGLE